MRKVGRAVLGFLMVVVLAGSDLARAETPECAREGQALYPATDDFSAKEVERTAQRLFGPAFARVVRDVPWDVVWRGDSSFSQSAYFIQGFEERLALPEVRFVAAAPAPLKIEIELRIKTDALPCVPIDVPGYPNFEMGQNEGAVAIRVPMMVLVTMSVGGISDRWELPYNEASVGWQREDGKLHVWLDAAGLKFGLPGPSAKGGVAETVGTLRHSRELARWKELLVRSLSDPGGHRPKTISILSELGFQELPGDVWVRLRRLQEAGKLRTAEVDRLGWLARRPDVVPDEEAAIFTAPASKPPPRLFVAGQEFSSWTRVGEQNEIRVPLNGFLPVRAEFGDGNSGQAFATVFGRGVRIRLIEDRGPTLQEPPPGPRCGLVRDKVSANCGHFGEPAPIARVFDLVTVCGAMPAASGSAIEFGLHLVPSLPGLYVRDRQRGLSFEPTYGTRTGAPTTCDTP